MGWAYCGKDSEGRDIGYAIPAKCDFPGCKRKIDRGLSYACGGEHGKTELSCEKYFCPEHLKIFEDTNGDSLQLCNSCYSEALEARYEELLEASKAQGFFDKAEKVERVRDGIIKAITSNFGRKDPTSEADLYAAMITADDILGIFKMEELIES